MVLGAQGHVASLSDFPLRQTVDTVTFLGGSKEYG